MLWVSSLYIRSAKLIHLNFKSHREFPDTLPLRITSNPGNAKVHPNPPVLSVHFQKTLHPFLWLINQKWDWFTGSNTLGHIMWSGARHWTVYSELQKYLLCVNLWFPNGANSFFIKPMKFIFYQQTLGSILYLQVFKPCSQPNTLPMYGESKLSFFHANIIAVITILLL